MASATYEPLNPWRCSKIIIQTDSDRAGTDVCTGYHISVLGNMVRNAGQLPQPFWLGAHGGGSCSAATVPART
jgi:hypothetical protein